MEKKAAKKIITSSAAKNLAKNLANKALDKAPDVIDSLSNRTNNKTIKKVLNANITKAAVKIKELETYEEELEIGTHYNYFNCK